MDDDDVLVNNSNLKCHVCGENEFEEREGFYYCQECGTKQDQVRHIEVDQEDDFNQEKLKTKKQKINVAKAEKPQLSSWECYNYILRGFVEELLSFGAKEELKLMTLQVWAAYLRRMEVAFFNRKQPDLPKLSIIYLQNDAETIYNHSKAARKKRQQKRSGGAGCTSGESKSSRVWRKSKRKLDEFNYSLTSATSGGTGFTSSTSANSNRAIKIDFNVRARAFYKRRMPRKHLEKHAADAERLMKCHKQPKTREINRSDYNLMLVNTKQIYSILAIALNLVEDEIQLCDLVRFIHEGHIGTTNVLKYFPENIANNGKEMLRKINFHKCPDKYTDKTLRDHVGLICKNIGIFEPRKPNIYQLVQRYAMELCLPKDVVDYIDRLINLLPPQFGTRTVGYYPGFEARAMAYIIFTLKLIYGLDGCKEHRMSRCAQKLNAKIEQLNKNKYENQPLLFVWNEWVEYIEMRKVIVSQFSSSFSEQFKQCQSTSQLLEQMAEEMLKAEDIDNLLNDSSNNIKNSRYRLKSFKSLFERFQESYKPDDNEPKKPPQLIEFKPSFTPALSYLKNILLFYDRERNENESIDLNIPDYMRIDHSQRNINSFLEVKPLIAYFERHQQKLNVHVLDTTKNRTFAGIFRAPRAPNRSMLKIQQASFDITEEEWAEIVMADVAQNTDDLGFQTELKPYQTSAYCEKLKAITKKSGCFNPYMNYDLRLIRDDTDHNGTNNDKAPKRNIISATGRNNDELRSMHSFELFNENNMDPIEDENFITEPRRNLENIDLFEGISDEESVLNEDDGDDIVSDEAEVSDEESALNEDVGDDIVQDDTEANTLNDKDTLSSLMAEEFIKLESISAKGKLNSSKSKKHTAKSKALKMYISNMDCWMMLGNLAMLTKAQKSQLQDKFPRSFTWLLETCAQTINVDWSAVYEQLLCIELMFCLGIKDPSTIKNCVYMNSVHDFKDIQTIVNTYREIW